MSNNFKLSKNSLDKLKGVHTKLQEVVKLALSLSEVDFGISEGVRSLERQKELVKAGKSQTMRSYHLVGKAVDVVAYIDGKPNWGFINYEKINKAFNEAAEQLDVKITWGGSWPSLRDGPHFQIEDV